MAVDSLYVVLKDHANESILFLFTKSQSRVLRREALKDGVDIESTRLLVGEKHMPSALTTLVITAQMDQKVANQLVEATRSIKSLIDMLVVN